MILDAEPPPKSRDASYPAVRQNQAASPSESPHPHYASYSTFSRTLPPHNVPSNSNHVTSEATTLLYQQSLFDDVQPPAYDEINTARPATSRNRFWPRIIAVFVVVFLCSFSWAFYHILKAMPKLPGDEPVKQPPPATSTSNKHPLPSPPPTTRDPPPKPSLPPQGPYIVPKSGRTDLCRPWAYSAHLGRWSSVYDNRPTDQLVYTVPSLAPLHIETSAICPSKNGGYEFCSDYDDSYDSIAGKLQVVGGDVELPEIRMSVQHASETGLDSVAVCLMKKPNEGAIGDSPHKWVLGLYIWKDPSTPGKGYVLASLSIVVTLPKSQVHSLSTSLNYFTQLIGPSVPTESNTLMFDTLRVHASERGEVIIRNIAASVIQSKSLTDNIVVDNCRVTGMIHLRSEYGILGCALTLVHFDNAPPVQVDLQAAFGAVSLRTKLEYSLTTPSSSRFEFTLRSESSPTALFVFDPHGTQLLRSHQFPQTLPIINVNATSRYAVAQVVVPVTYRGSVELASQYATIVTIDRASQLPGRIASWDKRGKVYRGDVQWVGRPGKAGSVHVSTEYATSRILFLGLEDDDIERWPE